MAEVRLGLTTTPKCDVTKDTLEYISTEPGEGRYRGSFAPFGGGTDLSKDDRWLLAASVGYEKFRDERLDIAGGGAAVFRRDFDEVAGSAAIKHKPTGLFAMGVFSISDSDDSNVFGGFNGQDAPTMRAWNVQAGIQRRLDFLSLNKLGETSLWGGYSDVKNGFAPGSSGVSGTALPWRLSQLPQRCCIRHCCQHDPSGKYVPSIPFATQVTGSDVNDWFIALDQNFEAAAFHLYAVYQHFDDPTLSLIDVARTHVPLKLDGFDLGYVGGRIYFQSKAKAPPSQELSEATPSGAAFFHASNGSESMLRGGHRLS